MSSGHKRITWRRTIAENFNRLSRVHERYRRQTDRQTTDGRTTTYSEYEHEFTFAKNQIIKVFKACVATYVTISFGFCLHSKEIATDEEKPMIRQAARLPSKPGRPVAEFDRDVHVTVKWTRPEDDGGGDITAYVIKYGYRLFMGIFPNYDTVKVAGDTTKFQFTDELKKKKKYQFAVAAVNTAGRGEFSEFSEYISTWPGEYAEMN